MWISKSDICRCGYQDIDIYECGCGYQNMIFADADANADSKIMIFADADIILMWIIHGCG